MSNPLGLCPCCEQANRELEVVEVEQILNVRGEAISVADRFFRCQSCGGEFDYPGAAQEPPEERAYREYRRRHNMLQPEEITARRERHKMFPEGLAHLLGWEVGALLRYEKGALQTAEHDQALRRVLVLGDEIK